MDRRRFLNLTTAGGLALVLMGHSPYRQWQVYRKQRLIIVTAADAPEASAIGEALAALLATELPESRAMAARARDSLEVVKLLASGQLDVALLSPVDARQALDGRGRFADNGAVALRALANLGSQLFVCLADFPTARAYELARIVAEHGRGLERTVAAAGPRGAALRDATPKDAAARDAAAIGSAARDVGESVTIPWHPGALEYSRGPAPFQGVADKVVSAFSAATDGVRNVRIDIRRRDVAPAADVAIVGVLGMDIKPKEGPAWYSIRLLFGQRDGRWEFLHAYHELPAEGPVWDQGGEWYRAIVERALASPGR
jgi:hypothetical protein